MKKAYVAPSVEVVKFDYSDQVVAASGRCTIEYVNTDGGVASVDSCTGDKIPHRYYD